jgi:hypothetical protein
MMAGSIYLSVRLRVCIINSAASACCCPARNKYRYRIIAEAFFELGMYGARYIELKKFKN